MSKRITFYRTWLSEIHLTMLFISSLIGSIILTDYFPESLIVGELFSIGESTIFLTLPVFWLAPFLILSLGIFGIYNTKYSLEPDGVFSLEGILSFSQKSYKVRYEDIKSVEMHQTLLGRIFDYGDIKVGSAALGSVEINFRGVASPLEVQEMIINERDRMQKAESKELMQQIDDEIEKEVEEREAFRSRLAQQNGGNY